MVRMRKIVGLVVVALAFAVKGQLQNWAVLLLNLAVGLIAGAAAGWFVAIPTPWRYLVAGAAALAALAVALSSTGWALKYYAAKNTGKTPESLVAPTPIAPLPPVPDNGEWIGSPRTFGNHDGTVALEYVLSLQGYAEHHRMRFKCVTLDAKGIAFARDDLLVGLLSHGPGHSWRPHGVLAFFPPDFTDGEFQHGQIRVNWLVYAFPDEPWRSYLFTDEFRYPWEGLIGPPGQEMPT
jgi:hypothetical protein